MFKKKSAPFIFAVAVLLFMAGEYVLFLSSAKVGVENSGSVWKGYYQLFFDGEYSSSYISNILKGTKLRGIVSLDTEKVSVFTYGGTKSLPLSKLSDFFVDNDPLHDPYLQALPGYFKGRFKGKNINIMYIPAVLSPFATWLELHKNLKSFDKWWVFPNFRVINSALKLGFAVVIELLIFILLGKKKMSFIITLLPWLFPLFFGSILYILTAVSFQFCWFLLIQKIRPGFKCYLNYTTPENWKKINPGGVLIFINIIMFFLGVIILKKNMNSLLLIFTGFFIQCLVTILDFGLIYFKHKNRQHRLFLPVTIKKKIRCLQHREIYALAVLIFIILTAPLVQRFVTGFSSFSIPAPSKELGNADLSFKELGLLYGLKTSDSLPDLSDFVAHRAFQEMYLYGMHYSFPVPGSAFSLDSYTLDGKVVIKRNIRKKLFTEQWYKSIISSVDSHGIIGMLVEQGCPTGVKRIEKRFIPSGKGFLLRYYFLSIFLIFPFLISIRGLGFVHVNGIKRIFIRRRRQVV